MSTNTIHIEQGRIGKDPELRYGKNGGNAFLSLSVCTSDSWKDRDGKWQNEANWFEVKLFGKTAEKVAQEAVKGGEVYLRGHMKTESWDSAEGKRSKMVVIPDMGHLRVLPPKPRDDQYQDEPEYRQPAQKRAPVGDEFGDDPPW